MRVVETDSMDDPSIDSSPQMDTDEEELYRMRYFEALRR